MAHSKLNRFHWHITDSQSFPFVSKYFPELAKYGAYSSSEIYTHDDVRQVVEFARVRGIQVIPEIDAPAHSGKPISPIRSKRSNLTDGKLIFREWLAMGTE